MDAWRDIRLKARECHRQALLKAKGVRKAPELLASALKEEDLQLTRYEPGSVVSKGVYGFLDRPSKMINVASGQTPENEAVVTAHELGHYKLHRDPRNEVTALAPGLGGDPIDSGAGRVEGYSPRERKEVQADIFAGEFLCPADWLREELLAHAHKPADIAKNIGVPPGLVLNQAIRALLLPPLEAPPPASPSPSYTLDPGQLEAATWS